VTITSDTSDYTIQLISSPTEKKLGQHDATSIPVTACTQT